jgi:hypothetical protein
VRWIQASTADPHWESSSTVKCKAGERTATTLRDILYVTYYTLHSTVDPSRAEPRLFRESGLPFRSHVGAHAAHTPLVHKGYPEGPLARAGLRIPPAAPSYLRWIQASTADPHWESSSTVKYKAGERTRPCEMDSSICRRSTLRELKYCEIQGGRAHPAM